MKRLSASIALFLIAGLLFALTSAPNAVASATEAPSKWKVKVFAVGPVAAETVSLVEYAARHAGEWFTKAGSKYGYTPPKATKTKIVKVYATPDDFAKGLVKDGLCTERQIDERSIRSWSGAAGCSTAYINLAMNPRDSLLVITIAHEFVHLAQAEASSCMIAKWNPWWLYEGTADYLTEFITTRISNFRMLEGSINHPYDKLLWKDRISLIKDSKNPLSLVKLEYDFPKENRPLAYATATLGTYFLVNTIQNKQALFRYFSLVKQSDDYHAEFVRAFGMSLPYFYTQFQRYLESLRK